MKRSRLDFLAQILEATKNGTTRERIAFQVEAHQDLIDNSLGLLKDLDLLMETHNSPISFVTSQKGLQFLHDYRRLEKQLSSETCLK